MSNEQRLDLVARNLSVSSDDPQAQVTTLRDQEAVKRISMQRWQRPYGQRVVVLYRERIHPDRPHAVRNIALGVVGQMELAQLDLDRNLP